MRLRYLAAAIPLVLIGTGPPTRWAPAHPHTQTLHVGAISPTLTAGVGEFVPSVPGHYRFDWSVNFSGHAGDHPVWVNIQRDLSDVALVNATLGKTGAVTVKGSVNVTLPDAAHPNSPWRWFVVLFVGTYGKYAATGATAGSTYTMTYLGP